MRRYKAASVAAIAGSVLFLIGWITGQLELSIIGILGLVVLSVSAYLPARFTLAAIAVIGLAFVAFAAFITRTGTNSADAASLASSPDARLTYPGSTRDAVSYDSSFLSYPRQTTVWRSSADTKTITAWFTSHLQGQGWGRPILACSEPETHSTIVWQRNRPWTDQTWAGPVTFPATEDVVLMLPDAASQLNPCEIQLGWPYHAATPYSGQAGTYAVTLVVRS